MNSADPTKTFERAASLHQFGRLAEARILYEKLLTQAPQHPDLLHQLGLLRGQQGDHSGAIDLIQRAIALRPANVHYHNNFANILKAAGRRDEAMLAYRRAAELEPNNAFAFANLANACLHLGNLDQAILNYRKAIDLQPRQPSPQPDRNLARMHNDLGVALAQMNRLDEALVELNAAIRIDSNYPDACNNLGSVLMQQGRLVEAVAAFNDAIRQKPDYPAPYNNLGITLTKLGSSEEALGAYRKAIELSPANAKFLTNFAQTLTGLGELDQAIEIAKKAIEAAPNLPAAHQALGAALRDVARLDESLAAFNRAVELDPKDASALSARIFTRHFHPGFDAVALANDQRLWDQRHAQPLAAQISNYPNDPTTDRPLRIGYISPDFTNHVLAFLMLPLFSHHDQSQFQMYFYSDVANPTPLTDRLVACGGQWRSIVGRSDEQVASMI